MSECWYIPDDIDYRCEENRFTPNEPCSYETLSSILVFYETHGVEGVLENIEFFAEALVKEMNYYAYDVITISEESMGDAFDALAEKHFNEHAHDDDEVRFIIDGEGYFDMRDLDDRWIRMLCKAGDCIVLPAGAYHRFTTTESRYIMAVRLFKKNPKWMSLSRHDGSATESHMRYLAAVEKPHQTIVGPSCGYEEDPDYARIYTIPFPLKLDETMEHIVQDFVARNGVVLLMYITGAASPYVGGESWCPDCIGAKPHIIDGFNKLCEKFDKKNIVYVEVPVERASYLQNPDYPLRHHEMIQLQCVPTLFVFTPNAKESSETTPWWELLNLKLRTESHTPDIMIDW